MGEPIAGEPVTGEPVTGGPATGLLATDVPAADWPLLTIGQLAAETGVPSSTIRFWERKGLLAPARRQSGQRRYEPTAARSVALLRLCQEAGLTLADIRRFRDERAVTPGSWHTLVEQKLADVERQITALEHARKLLSHAATCHHDDLLACPGFQEWFETYLNQSEAEHPTSDRP
jgi:DNA-binding transcriptional MerR regulator